MSGPTDAELGITTAQRRQIDRLMFGVNYLRSYVGLHPVENPYVFFDGEGQIAELTRLERETEREVAALYLPIRLVWVPDMLCPA